MKKRLLSAIALLLMMGVLHPVLALEPTLKAQIESKLGAAFGPQVKVRSVEKLANDQLLEVTLIDGSIIYMTPDSSFFIYSDSLYQLTAQGPQNVTEQRLNPIRVKHMAGIKDTDTVVFKAKGTEKAKISIYTDIECPYCQKLHDEVPRLNELGITVRYLAFPRAGIMDPRTGQPTTAYQKINYVWCAKQKAQAMTDMKNTQKEIGSLAQKVRQGGGSDAEKEYNQVESKMSTFLAGNTSCPSAVKDQYRLAQEMGINGTPAIIGADGVLIPGYMPAEELVRRLGL